MNVAEILWRNRLGISRTYCERSNYIKVNNHHLFFQLRVQNIDDIKKICKKKNQEIHIIEVNMSSVENIILNIIDAASDAKKLVFHVPKTMKDFDRWFEYKFGKCKRVHLSIESKGFRIKIKQMEKPSVLDMDLFLNVTYNNAIKGDPSITISMDLVDIIYSKDMIYNDNSNLGFISSKFELENPELYKDRILKRFKKNTPKSIKEKTFNNDDEKMWDYIIEMIDDEFKEG